MTAQDLQRTLGVKLEDLQAHGGIIGIQQGGTTRTVKIEDLTGGNANQSVGSQGVNQVIINIW